MGRLRPFSRSEKIMWIRKAALAAWIALLCVQARITPAAEPLTLDVALARIVAQHPSLLALDLGTAALQAEAEHAAQAPPLTLGAEVENVAGTGVRSGIDGAEWTLTLAGVLERGGKRALRAALAARRIDAQASRRSSAALALLAEGAHRYLDVVAADGEVLLAREELRDRERWRDLAQQRSDAGATPAATPLLAEANAARARFELERASTQRVLAWQRLALLWGALPGEAESGELAANDVLALPPAPQVNGLQALLARNPELAAFSADTRLRESRLRLLEAARATDVSWHAGLRRLEDGDDWALVAGVSLALDARSRAEPEVRAARAELEALAFEREAGGRRLLGLLLEAQGMYVAARLQVERLRDDVLPRYDAANSAAERAWRAGALSPLEWSELQNERLAARRTQLAAALAARRALIEIQSLTAEPLRNLPAAGERP
jgi:outer membrane protein, heavy metal efflux system